LQLPPNESLSSRVSFESYIRSKYTLYGTKNPFLFLSPNALIQFAKASKDLLILAPSISLIPLFYVTVPLSDPAKSINESLPIIF